MTSRSQVSDAQDAAASKPPQKLGPWLSESELDALSALDPMSILESTERALEEAREEELRPPQPISWGDAPQEEPAEAPTPPNDLATTESAAPEAASPPQASPTPQAAVTPANATPAPPPPAPEAMAGNWAVVYLPWRQQADTNSAHGDAGTSEAPTPAPTEAPAPPANEVEVDQNPIFGESDASLVEEPSTDAWAQSERTQSEAPHFDVQPPVFEERTPEPAPAPEPRSHPFAQRHAETPPRPNPAQEPPRERSPFDALPPLASTAARPDPERAPEVSDWPMHGVPHSMPEPFAAQRDAQLLVARRMVLPLGMAEHAQVRVEVWSNPSERTPRYRAAITIEELPVRGADSLDEALLSVREWLFNRLSGQQPVWRRGDGR